MSLVPQGAITSAIGTLFIGWPIDYTLLRNIHWNLEDQ